MVDVSIFLEVVYGSAYETSLNFVYWNDIYCLESYAMYLKVWFNNETQECVAICV